MNTVKEQRTRHIDYENRNQKVTEKRAQLARRTKGLEDKRALARDTNWVENVESVVSSQCETHQRIEHGSHAGGEKEKQDLPQPSPPARDRVPRQSNSEETVTDNLRNSPSKNTPQIRIITQLGIPPSTNNLPTKLRHNPPYQQEPARNLHGSRHERRAHEAYHAVHDFQQGEGLRDQQ